MACAICTHKDRLDIEADLRSRNIADTNITLQSIADDYDVNITDLQVHAMTHSFATDKNKNTSVDAGTATKPVSFVDAIEYREALYLREVIADNIATLRETGEIIRRAAKEHDDNDVPSLYRVPKQIVDLYKFCSESVTDAILDLAKVNNLLGNDIDDGTKALGQLALVIQSSVQDVPSFQENAAKSSTSQTEEDDE